MIFSILRKNSLLESLFCWKLLRNSQGYSRYLFSKHFTFIKLRKIVQKQKVYLSNIHADLNFRNGDTNVSRLRDSNVMWITSNLAKHTNEIVDFSRKQDSFNNVFLSLQIPSYSNFIVPMHRLIYILKMIRSRSLRIKISYVYVNVRACVYACIQTRNLVHFKKEICANVSSRFWWSFDMCNIDKNKNRYFF